VSVPQAGEHGTPASVKVHPNVGLEEEPVAPAWRVTGEAPTRMVEKLLLTVTSTEGPKGLPAQAHSVNRRIVSTDTQKPRLM
jgi:hypothetical protein